jgi:D-glycero-alpha-D-manno-heptose-7-phosphate kinase
MSDAARAPMRTIHARAPVRVCDNGGWTDTWFAKHGAIFNIAVAPNAEVDIDVYPRDARAHAVEICAENYAERFAPDGSWSRHPLLEAALSLRPPPPELALDVRLRCAVPAGAGTGTSAAVTVALLAALDHVGVAPREPTRMDPDRLALAAHAVETDLLKRQCGIQDQLAAAHGGVCFIDMDVYPSARVTRLDHAVAAHVLSALEARLCLVYLGKQHDSSRVHEHVIHELEDAGPDDARIEALRRTAMRSRDALLAGDLDALGAAMIDNTDAQTGLNSALVGVDARRVIAIAREHRAVGWKVNGAGGDGGSLTLLLASANTPAALAKTRRALIEHVEAAGPYRDIPIRLNASGAQAWTS